MNNPKPDRPLKARSAFRKRRSHNSVIDGIIDYENRLKRLEYRVAHLENQWVPEDLTVADQNCSVSDGENYILRHSGDENAPNDTSGDEKQDDNDVGELEDHEVVANANDKETVERDQMAHVASLDCEGTHCVGFDEYQRDTIPVVDESQTPCVEKIKDVQSVEIPVCDPAKSTEKQSALTAPTNNSITTVDFKEKEKLLERKVEIGQKVETRESVLEGVGGEQSLLKELQTSQGTQELNDEADFRKPCGNESWGQGKSDDPSYDSVTDEKRGAIPKRPTWTLKGDPPFYNPGTFSQFMADATRGDGRDNHRTSNQWRQANCNLTSIQSSDSGYGLPSWLPSADGNRRQEADLQSQLQAPGGCQEQRLENQDTDYSNEALVNVPDAPIPSHDLTESADDESSNKSEQSRTSMWEEEQQLEGEDTNYSSETSVKVLDEPVESRDDQSSDELQQPRKPMWDAEQQLEDEDTNSCDETAVKVLDEPVESTDDQRSDELQQSLGTPIRGAEQQLEDEVPEKSPLCTQLMKSEDGQSLDKATTRSEVKLEVSKPNQKKLSRAMSTEHRQVLRQKSGFLAEDMQVNTVLLVHLYQNGVLELEDKQNINEKKTCAEKVDLLLDILRGKGEHAFEVLCEGVKKNGQNYIADQLRDSCSSGIETMPQTFDICDDTGSNIDVKLMLDIEKKYRLVVTIAKHAVHVEKWDLGSVVLPIQFSSVEQLDDYWIILSNDTYFRTFSEQVLNALLKEEYKPQASRLYLQKRVVLTFYKYMEYRRKFTEGQSIQVKDAESTLGSDDDDTLRRKMRVMETELRNKDIEMAKLLNTKSEKEVVLERDNCILKGKNEELQGEIERLTSDLQQQKLIVREHVEEKRNVEQLFHNARRSEEEVRKQLDAKEVEFHQMRQNSERTKESLLGQVDKLKKEKEKLETDLRPAIKREGGNASDGKDDEIARLTTELSRFKKDSKYLEDVKAKDEEIVRLKAELLSLKDLSKNMKNMHSLEKENAELKENLQKEVELRTKLEEKLKTDVLQVYQDFIKVGIDAGEVGGIKYVGKSQEPNPTQKDDPKHEGDGDVWEQRKVTAALAFPTSDERTRTKSTVQGSDDKEQEERVTEAATGEQSGDCGESGASVTSFLASSDRNTATRNKFYRSDSEACEKSKGLDTVFCIDCSGSMGDEGMRQVKEAFMKLMDDIQKSAEVYGLEENVGVVFFGRYTERLQTLTCNYKRLRRIPETLVAGGGTPMVGGLVESHKELMTKGGKLICNNRWIPSRVVLLTDGYPNEDDPHTVFDDRSRVQSARMRVLTAVSLWQNYGDMVPAVHLSVVACGEQCDKDFLSSIASNGKGVFTTYDDDNGLRRISGFYRRSYYVNKFVAPFADKSRIGDVIHNKNEFKNWMIGAVTLDGRPPLDFNDPFELDECYQMVMDICTGAGDPSSDEANYEPQDTEMTVNMPLGSRVFYIGADDKNPKHSGTGTVVKHHSNGTLTVEWDNSGQQHRYDFGKDGHYEVMKTDEPRSLEAGDTMIKVGVMVERGKDWKWGDQDGGPGSVGVVFGVEDSGVAKVCWPSGHRNTYRNGAEGKYDLKIAESKPPKELSTFPFQEPPGKSIVWSYLDACDQWLMYSQETTMLLELKYTDSRQGSTQMDIDGVLCNVDFRDMEATRGDNITQIAREELDEDAFNSRLEVDLQLRRKMGLD